MEQFNISEAKAHFSELIRKVLAGQEVAIVKGRKVVARLVPAGNNQAQARIGGAKGKIWMADDFDAPLGDFKDYR